MLFFKRQRLIFKAEIDLRNNIIGVTRSGEPQLDIREQSVFVAVDIARGTYRKYLVAAVAFNERIKPRRKRTDAVTPPLVESFIPAAGDISFIFRAVYALVARGIEIASICMPSTS